MPAVDIARRRARSAVRIAVYLVYQYGAALVPSRLRWMRKVRVALLRLSGRDVAWSAHINSYARIGSGSTIADHAGVGEGSILSGEVHLGRHVTMGPGCRFFTGDHPIPPDRGHFRDMRPRHRPIYVEEDVFLGAGVIVLSGVTIGRCAAVGAGSVVSKDVAPGATVVGNPAREVRRREPPAPSM
jgi:maltose O-acetyltransferase